MVFIRQKRSVPNPELFIPEPPPTCRVPDPDLGKSSGSDPNYFKHVIGNFKKMA